MAASHTQGGHDWRTINTRGTLRYHVLKWYTTRMLALQIEKRLVWKLWFILSACMLLYLGTFSDVMNPKCHLEADTLNRSDTRKNGIDNPNRIQWSFTESYLLWPPACRLLSTFAKVDEPLQKWIHLNSLFPSALLDRMAGWRAERQLWIWLPCMPTYLSTGYCTLPH